MASRLPSTRPTIFHRWDVLRHVWVPFWKPYHTPLHNTYMGWSWVRSRALDKLPLSQWGEVWFTFLWIPLCLIPESEFPWNQVDDTTK